MKRVLIVEDNQQLVPLMVRTLEQDGYEVLGVTTLKEALLVAHDVDMLVVDRELQDGDGTTLLKRFPEKPALIVSGSGPADLYKPFHPRDLRDRVREKLGLGAME